MSIEKSELKLEPTIDEAMAHYQKFQMIKQKILNKQEHIVMINNKPYIKRSGWQAVGHAFGISTKIIKEEREERGKDFGYRIWVEAKSPNGRTVVGDGACFSNERNFAHQEHDIYAIAHTRASNRAISNSVGSGEISAEEMKPEVVK